MLYEAARVLFQEVNGPLKAYIRASLQFVLDTLRGFSPPGCPRNAFLQALMEEFPQLYGDVWDSQKLRMEASHPENSAAAYHAIKLPSPSIAHPTHMHPASRNAADYELTNPDHSATMATDSQQGGTLAGTWYDRLNSLTLIMT